MAKLKNDVLQGTPDLLILKTLEKEPMHGYGIASRIERISDELLRVEEGSPSQRDDLVCPETFGI